MKHKLLVVLLAMIATLCMAFGLVGCGEKSDETGNDPPITDPSGDEQGEQGNQGNQGNQGGTQKPDEEQEPETYTEGLCFTEMYGEDGTTVIGYSVGAGEAADEEEIVIPSKYNNLPVRSVSRSESDKAFWNKYNEEASGLTEQEALAVTQKYSFCGCTNLKKIKMPDSVTLIGYAAFGGCSALTSVIIGNGVISIENQAFAYCEGLTSVIIPDSVTTIGIAAFGGCSALTSVTIPNSVTEIGQSAFAYCEELTSVTIGSGVTSIKRQVFEGCNELKKIEVSPDNKTYHAKNNCLIEKSSKTLVAGCKSSIIPDDGSVTKIGQSAFSYCKGLISIAIPHSVTEIEDLAFFGCEGLKEVHFENPNGWKVSLEYLEEETPVSGLDDPSTAAKNLTETYNYYFWKRG